MALYKCRECGETFNLMEDEAFESYQRGHCPDCALENGSLGDGGENVATELARSGLSYRGIDDE